MTLKEKIIATAYTGVAFVEGDDLGKLYEYVDTKMEDGALDIKWASKTWVEGVRNACKDDFLAMLAGKYAEEDTSEQRNPFIETLTKWGFEPHKSVKDMTEEELYKLIKFAVVRAKESY